MPLYFLVVPVPTTLAPAERWVRFVKPLHDALTRTRVGKILDLDEVMQEVDGRPVVAADQLEIELKTWSGGMRLLNRILKAQGLPALDGGQPAPLQNGDNRP
ncbi:MAG: hypothetical protein U0793_30690 [Gemmataceae bacterium]